MMEKNVPSISAGKAFFPFDVNDNFSVKRKDEACAPPKTNAHEVRPKNENKRDIVPMQNPLHNSDNTTHKVPQTSNIAYPPYPEEKEQISNHTEPHQTTPTTPNNMADAGQAEFGKKMRKPKRRFRPWFTAC